MFEADFNAIFKWLGQVVMLHAENIKLLAKEQYGSHKVKSVILQCLNRGLFYNYLWICRQPAALYSNNTKSC